MAAPYNTSNIINNYMTNEVILFALNDFLELKAGFKNIKFCDDCKGFKLLGQQ